VYVDGKRLSVRGRAKDAYFWENAKLVLVASRHSDGSSDVQTFSPDGFPLELIASPEGYGISYIEPTMVGEPRIICTSKNIADDWPDWRFEIVGPPYLLRKLSPSK